MILEGSRNRLGMKHRALGYGLLLAFALSAKGVLALEMIPSCETRDLGAGLLFVRGTVAFDAPVKVAYSVVSEYDSLSRFVSAMDSSYVLSRDSVGAVVRQVGTMGLLVRRSVRTELRFEEHPPSLLRFEILNGDFPTYYGTWRFEDRDAETWLVYSVTLKPPSFVPHWLLRSMLEQVLCKTLREVAEECMRRGKESPSQSR